MTIWAYNQKIFSFIIFSVFVLVVDPKDFLNFIISTTFAFLDYSSTVPEFSQTIFRRWFYPTIQSVDIGTFSRTKFSNFTRSIMEYFFANSAFFFGCSTVIHNSRSIITLPRTIFSFVTSRGNMFKFLIAHCTIRFYFNSCMKSLTFSRAVFSFFKTIDRNIEFFKTIQTFYKFSSMRFIRHATP